MSKLDEAIRDALSEEDVAFMARFEKQPSFFREFFSVYAGPFTFVNVLVTVALIPILGIAGFAVWKFAVLEDLRAIMHWGWIAAFFVAAAFLVRFWFLMQIQTNLVIREIKRLELQVARLASRDMV